MPQAVASENPPPLESIASANQDDSEDEDFQSADEGEEEQEEQQQQQQQRQALSTTMEPEIAQFNEQHFAIVISALQKLYLGHINIHCICMLSFMIIIAHCTVCTMLLNAGG